jgi:thiamine-phosphate pyrophosphorylase
MAKAQEADDKRPAPRLYLVTPPLGEARGLSDRLAEALAAAGFAAVLLRLEPAPERDLINRVKHLAPVVQSCGVALLLDGHADLAARAGTDGAHLTGIAAFTAAIDSLKPARIAGCGGLATRHDAMLAGERGADYVMLGDPATNGRRPAFDAILDRVEWWAELFEIPCVGFAAALSEIAPLAAAGADFVAVEDAVWNDPRGPAVAVAEAARLLPETVP